MKGDHTTFHSGYLISYWIGNTAAGSLDQWDRASIRFPGQTNSVDVRTPYDLGKMCILLDEVFERGKAAKAEEIRKVLGVKQQ